VIFFRVGLAEVRLNAVRTNIATTMTTTSAYKRDNSQFGSADAEFEETIAGLGDGIPAASNKSFRSLEEAIDKSLIRTRGTAYLAACRAGGSGIPKR
jgi:hypothetical protein